MEFFKSHFFENERKILGIIPDNTNSPLWSCKHLLKSYANINANKEMIHVNCSLRLTLHLYIGTLISTLQCN